MKKKVAKNREKLTERKKKKPGKARRDIQRIVTKDGKDLRIRKTECLMGSLNGE